MVYAVPKNASFGLNPSVGEELIKKLILNLESKRNIRLTKKELKELFNALGSRWSSWRAWRGMRYADVNGDGFITHEEILIVEQLDDTRTTAGYCAFRGRR
ncbi:hypothetical protein QQ045_024988 [Rhodiola kirilowii]